MYAKSRILDGVIMASVIWLSLKEQKPLKQFLAEGNAMKNPFARGEKSYSRPIIAKGNSIEGVIAQT